MKQLINDISHLSTEAQDKIKITLGRYTEDASLDVFNTLHIYPSGVPCIDGSTGYHDSQHFELVGYHWMSRKFRLLGRHDRINGMLNEITVYAIGIFADGSTYVTCKNAIKLKHNFQCIEFFNS